MGGSLHGMAALSEHVIFTYICPSVVLACRASFVNLHDDFVPVSQEKHSPTHDNHCVVMLSREASHCALKASQKA